MITEEELQYQSFRVIRQYVNDITHDNLSNDEIAGFVKGVCSLEREISLIQEEHQREYTQMLNKNLEISLTASKVAGPEV